MNSISNGNILVDFSYLIVRFYLQWKEQNPNKKPFEPKASWRGTSLGTDPECLLDFGFGLIEGQVWEHAYH
jgi:hypothetical protein